MKRQVYNPYLPLNEYIPDGEPHVFDDRIYVFGSHDKEDGETFCMLDYVFWSAPVDDLSSWSNNGVSYRAEQDPLYSENNKYLYAPDVVKGNDGKYYLYYCLSGYKGKGGYTNPISVAVSDRPDGPYEYLGYVRNKDGSPMMEHINFDPALINDEGQIRLYYGSRLSWFDRYPGPIRDKLVADLLKLDLHETDINELEGCFEVELEDDMLTIKAPSVRIDDKITDTSYFKHNYFEGSSIRKISDKYYFIYSSALNHELCYAISDKPDSDFRFKGTIVSNGDVGYKGRSASDKLNMTGTTHGSIECINGQWYVFYHRLTHRSDYSRQGCAEKIKINDDGTIDQVEVTSCGLNDGPLKAEGEYPAVICCNLSNGRMPHGSNQKEEYDIPYVGNDDRQRHIANINDDTLIGYKYFEFKGNTALKISCRKGPGTFEITDEEKTLSEIKITESKDWREYETVFELYGVHPLYLKYKGKAAELLDLEFA